MQLSTVCMKERCNVVNQSPYLNPQPIPPHPMTPTKPVKPVKPLLIGLGYMGLHLALMFLVQIVASVICVAKATAELGSGAAKEKISELAETILYQNLELISIITQVVTILTVVVIFLILRACRHGEERPSVKSFFTLNKIKPSVCGMTVLLAFCMYFLVISLLSVIGTVFPDLLENYNNAMTHEGETKWFLMFLTTVIGAPLVEELIYRNMSINNLRKTVSPVIAILISSIVFGVAHGNLLQAIYAGLLGGVFGFLFVRTDSIYPSLIGHAVFNGIGFLFSYIGELLENSAEDSPEMMTYTIVVSVLILLSYVGGPLTIWWFERKTKKIVQEQKLQSAYAGIPIFPQTQYGYGYNQYQKNYNAMQYSGSQTPYSQAPYQGYSNGPYGPYQAPYTQPYGQYQSPYSQPYGQYQSTYGNYPYAAPSQNQAPTSYSQGQGSWVFDPRFGWIFVKQPVQETPHTPTEVPPTTPPSDEKNTTSADSNPLQSGTEEAIPSDVLPGDGEETPSDSES